MARPKLNDDSATVRETYTMSADLRDRFALRVDELELPSKSDVVRDLLETWLRRTATDAPERRIYDRARKQLLKR